MVWSRESTKNDTVRAQRDNDQEKELCICCLKGGWVWWYMSIISATLEAEDHRDQGRGH
jgi:hypothetical protein